MEPCSRKVSSQNQITLPAAVRNKLGVRPGDKVVFTEDIEVISLDKGQTLITAKNALQGHDFSDNAIDYAIGYAYKRKIPMLTNNKRHFKWLSEVYMPAGIMEKY
jgi:AbrB family looped-hinge helix DNA binding protein